jgi:hypothetical protein
LRIWDTAQRPTPITDGGQVLPESLMALSV